VTTRPMRSVEPTAAPPTGPGGTVVTELPVHREPSRPQLLQLSTKLDERFALVRVPGGAKAHAFRLLRHRMAAQGDPSVIAVTSASAGEGKTTCALNLALALAEETPRTILVEASSKRPMLAKLFGANEEPAEGDGTALFRVASIGLDVWRGPRAEQPLRRVEFLPLIQGLRAAYDYVVIDTTAALESVDANIAAEASDAVLFAVRAGQTRRRLLRRATEQLSPARIMGLVLVDAPRKEAT